MLDIIAMGRKEETQDTATAAAVTAATNNKLSIKVPPSFFRCPISLDVMKSPVSLCTGVTYDRSSIQRWLDSGNNTCPATMQPLPSTDLIPNLTLHRLINLWGWGNLPHPLPLPLPSKVILEDIRSSPDPVPAINNLFDIICSSSDNDDDLNDNSTLVGGSGGAAVLLASKLADQTTLRVAEPLVALVSKILTQESCRSHMLSALADAGLDAVFSSLLLVLKDGSTLDSRTNAAAVLDAVVRNVPPSDGESKVMLAEKPDLIPELVGLASREPLDRAAVEAALSCLVGLSEVRRARFRMVRLGIVSLSTRILRGQEKAVGPAAAEKALKLLEVASGCSEGREEICELGERCIGAVLGRMMKVGTESGVVVLWSVCHLFRDRRAQEAVTASNGGLTKILLLMQSDCSAAVRQMTGDLLKIFRVNSKSCLSGYDTKTTHIMPF